MTIDEMKKMAEEALAVEHPSSPRYQLAQAFLQSYEENAELKSRMDDRAQIMARQSETLKQLGDDIEKRNKLLLWMQYQCGYASLWWIRIEQILNPENPVLKEKES